MADEVDNHTIRPLQEMRAEFSGRFDRLERDVAGMRADLTKRVDGNAVLLNMAAGMFHSHEGRISSLEQDKA